MKKNLYNKPIYDVINKIDSTDKKSVLLVGPRGSGKTTVINRYTELNKEVAIDCTYSNEELLKIKDNEVYKLYHVCILINKILNYIEDIYPLCINYFNEYVTNIKILLFYINNMVMIDDYNKKEELFGELCKNPEILLDDFCDKLQKYMDYDNLMLIFDNFDIDDRYQKIIYDLLKNKIKTIFVSSDKELLSNTLKKGLLQKENDIVEVDYSYDIKYVKDILNMMIKDSILFEKIIYINNNPLLDNNLVYLLINITNGNIREMYNIVMHLYKYQNIIPKDSYMDFIVEYYKDRLDYLNNNIGMKRERKISI